MARDAKALFARCWIAKYFAKFWPIATIVLLATHASLWQANALEPGAKPRVFGQKHTVGAETEALVRIVDGTLTTRFPSVGALLHVSDGGFTTYCTGTIIGCDAFLTAAHCVASDPDKTHYKVFLQHGGLFDIRALDWPKRDYRRPSEETGSQADIAVLRLTKPVEGLVPQLINDDREQAMGSPSQIVGFGRTAGENMNTGLKRFGDVIASSCPDKFPKSGLVCWRYAPKEGANTCYGDSGGPLLLEQNRPKAVVSGVTSGGIDLTCAKLDRAYDTSVFKNSAWVKKAAGLDSPQARCGSLLPLDTDGSDRYQQVTGQINADFPQHVFEVSVQNATQLRVGANLAKPIGTTDHNFVKTPQLYVLPGHSRNPSEASCQSQPRAQVVFCEMKLPADGVYTIILRSGDLAGTADFQLVVSVY